MLYNSYNKISTCKYEYCKTKNKNSNIFIYFNSDK